MSRFVFFDRDGTLVADTGYPHRREDYALLPGVTEGLQLLAEAGFRLAIVTNQSGIGRGMYDLDAFHAFQDLLLADLARAGIQIAGSFLCPHLPGAGCGCRKPSPGLLFQARDALGADLANSWIVGDHERDAQAGLAAGCRGAALVGRPVTEVLTPNLASFPDLPAAARWILESSAG